MAYSRRLQTLSVQENVERSHNGEDICLKGHFAISVIRLI